MSKRSRRGRALRRRHGHFGMADVHSGTAGIRKLMSDNPEVTAAAIGATTAALVVGMGRGAAMAVGAAAGVAVQQATRK